MKFSNTNLTKVIIGSLILVLMVTTVYGNFFKRSYNTEEKVNELMKIIDTYYDGEYNKEEMVEEMYRGLINGVDNKYTSYLDAKAYQSFKESTEGSYVGIGTTVSFDPDDNKIEIVMPFPGSPSEKAGLKPGDKILKVNDIEVFGDKLEEAISLMKGKPGTVVKIQVIHKATGETSEVDIVREEINIPTIVSEMLEDNTGYIRLIGFDQVTTNQYFEAYSELESQGMEKLILDVRDNPGGLLNVVNEIADSLLPEGLIVYVEDKNKEVEYHYSDAKKIEIPLALLVNEYSASASEVLAEAVKDHKVGTIVGEKTYGKGSVQTVVELKDGSAVKVTIAKYFSPNGYCIQDVGVEPDVVVEYDETLNGSTMGIGFEEDLQLQKAFEIVNSGN